MRIGKKHSFIFKFIAIALIQAFLVMDFACCGEAGFCSGAIKQERATLAPQVQLTKEGFRDLFLKIGSRMEGAKKDDETPALAAAKPGVSEAQTEKKTTPSGIISSAKAALATAVVLLMFLLPLKIGFLPMNSNAMAQPPPAVSLYKQKALAELTQLSEKWQLTATGELSTIRADMGKQELVFSNEKARQRVRDVNKLIERIWRERNKAGTLDDYIVKRGDSPEAIAIGKALLLIQIFDEETYKTLKENNTPIFIGKIPCAGYTRGARARGEFGQPIVFIHERYLEDIFWFTHVLGHESVHVDRFPQHVWDFPLSFNAITFLRDWLFTESVYEENLAFKKDARFIKNFKIIPIDEKKEAFFDDFDLMTPYYHAKWIWVLNDIIGTFLFNIIPAGLAYLYLKKRRESGTMQQRNIQSAYRAGTVDYSARRNLRAGRVSFWEKLWNTITRSGSSRNRFFSIAFLAAGIYQFINPGNLLAASGKDLTGAAQAGFQLSTGNPSLDIVVGMVVAGLAFFGLRYIFRRLGRDTAKEKMEAAAKAEEEKVKEVSRQLDRMKAAETAVSEQVKDDLLKNIDRSRVCNLPNRQRFVEDLVEDLSKGKDVQVVFMSIQNFKGEFNDRGTALGLGHEFGDFGIQSVANHLGDSLSELLAGTGVNFKVYNDAKSYWVIFDTITPGFDAASVLSRLLDKNSEFKKRVVEEVKASVEAVRKEAEDILKVKLATGQMETQEYAQALIKLDKLRNVDNFRTNNFNVYAGISRALSLFETRLGAVLTAQRLDSQALLAAKFAQVGFDREELDVMEKMARENRTDALNREIERRIAEGKINPQSTWLLYQAEIRRDVNFIIRANGTKGEWEPMYAPISLIFNPQTTYQKLLDAYELALASADAAVISKAKENIYRKMAVYASTSDVAKRTKTPIFYGNDLFKAVINSLITARPGEDWSGVFRVGGDEFGKVTWDSATGILSIYRFDVNNLSKVNFQWGVKMGDRLIDEMARLFGEIGEQGQYMKEIYNFFSNKNPPGQDRNMQDNPWLLEKADYEYIAERLVKAGKEISDYLFIEDGKYYLKQVPPVLVRITDLETGAIIGEYESSPSVSVGVVHIDTKLIPVSQANMDFSAIQGRADTKAEEVKLTIKRHQAIHHGKVKPQLFTALDEKMVAEPFHAKDIDSFIEEKIDALRGELTGFVFKESRTAAAAVAGRENTLKADVLQEGQSSHITPNGIEKFGLLVEQSI